MNGRGRVDESKKKWTKAERKRNKSKSGWEATGERLPVGRVDGDSVAASRRWFRGDCSSGVSERSIDNKRRKEATCLDRSHFFFFGQSIDLDNDNKRKKTLVLSSACFAWLIFSRKPNMRAEVPRACTLHLSEMRIGAHLGAVLPCATSPRAWGARLKPPSKTLVNIVGALASEMVN